MASKYEKFVRSQIGDDWFEQIGHLFLDDRMKTAMKVLKGERKRRNVYPPSEDVFTAFRLTPYSDVKVVILGQDPYHQPKQAHGLAFSVKDPYLKHPPSLRNILTEAEKSTGLNIRDSGDLTRWAEQGVFLLNRYLTVVEGMPGSHSNLWKWFTDKVITTLNDRFHPTLFLLWGNKAQEVKPFISDEFHYILETSHPSPFSYHKGFKDSNHFHDVNVILTEGLKLEPIDWR